MIGARILSRPDMEDLINCNAVHTIAELRRTRKVLSARYNRKPKALSNWSKALKIPRPGKCGAYKRREVLLLDVMWLGLDLFHVNTKEIVECFVEGENKNGFKAWDEKYKRIDDGEYFYQLLATLDHFVEQYITKISLDEYLLGSCHSDSAVVMELVEIYRLYKRYKDQKKGDKDGKQQYTPQ